MVNLRHSRIIKYNLQCITLQNSTVPTCLSFWNILKWSWSEKLLWACQMQFVPPPQRFKWSVLCAPLVAGIHLVVPNFALSNPNRWVIWWNVTTVARKPWCLGTVCIFWLFMLSSLHHCLWKSSRPQVCIHLFYLMFYLCFTAGSSSAETKTTMSV